MQEIQKYIEQAQTEICKKNLSMYFCSIVEIHRQLFFHSFEHLLGKEGSFGFKRDFERNLGFLQDTLSK